MPNKQYGCTVHEYEVHREEYDGLCLSCGHWTCGDTEPDAQGYTCEECGANEVFGCDHVLITGELEIFENDEDIPDSMKTMECLRLPV